MRKPFLFNSSLIGLALAGSILIGCQNILDNTNANQNQTNATTPDNIALRLVEKTTPSCVEMKAKLTLNPSDTSTLKTKYLSQCIENHTSDSTHVKDSSSITRPDAKTQCDWIKFTIDGGKVDFKNQFAYYCKDECSKWEKDGTGKNVRYCLIKEIKLSDSLPKPIPHDTTIVPPKPDSTNLPSCDSLRMMLKHAGNDSTYKKMLLAQMSLKHCIIDTVIVIPPPVPHYTCDTLRILLKNAGTNSELIAKLKAQMLAQHCTMDTVIVTPPPVPHYTCDTLRILLKNAGTNSELIAKLKAQMVAQHCVMDTVIVTPPPAPHYTCDSLRVMLKNAGTNTELVNKIKLQMNTQHCVTDTLIAPQK